MALVKERSTIKVWGDVIFAIFLREIKSKFSDKLGIIWAVISPLSFILMMSSMRGVLGGETTHSMPNFFFMAYGLVYIQLLISTISAAGGAIQKNKSLFAFRQVQPISSIIACCGLELLIKIFVIIPIFLFAAFLRLEIQIADPLEVILNLIKVWLIGMSIGTLFSLASCYVTEVTKIQSLLIRPLLFISGTFFSLQDFHPSIWPYLDWNPILHAIELSRQAAYPTFGAVGVSDFYLDISTLVCVFFALACYHISWKQAISR